MSKIKILVVDDHAIMRDAIRALLDLHRSVEVIGEADGGRAAIDKARKLAPDVILMDIAMPDMDGLEATRRIKREFPETKVIMVSQYDNKEHILTAIKAGADGYVPKSAASTELLTAITAVSEGNPFLYPSVATALIQDYREQRPKKGDADLTGRQREILKLVTAGHTSREIAGALSISHKTVSTHRAKLMKRLALHRHTDLVKYAMRRGMADIGAPPATG